MNYKIKKVSGDASFRKFYRLEENRKSSILVFAEKERFKNLIIYIIVNKILNLNKVPAPKLIKECYKKNYIKITDLGDKSFYSFVKEKKSKFSYYRKLIDLLIKIQKIKLKKKYRYKNKIYKFKKYSIKELHKESDLFFDWYLRFTTKNKNLKKIKYLLKKELNSIYKKIKFENNIFTHRDFHASNVMIKDKKFYVIDSQDAIIGNPLYDLASLIDDIRLKISKKDQDKLFRYYIKKKKLKLKDQNFIRKDFDILSVQRNLKILGVFVRLSKRDNKHNYLKFLPYTWKMIQRRLKNPVFKNLNYILRKNLQINKIDKINKL